MLKLQVQASPNIKSVDPGPLKQAFNVIQRRFADASGTVSVGFVGSVKMKALNQQYAGEDKSTDVLSFNYQEGGGRADGEELGDVVINIDAARRQSHQYGLALAHEVALLATHGVLHLLGYDHQTRASRQALDVLQAEILKSAGLPYRSFWV